MKLIHCADLHLDSRLTNLREEEAGMRRAELLASFPRLAERAEREKAAAVLISGDLFDADTVSRQAENAFLDTVRMHPGILFFYLRGNHDRSGFSTEKIPENLKLFGRRWRTYVLEEPEEVRAEEPAGAQGENATGKQLEKHSGPFFRPVAVTGAELDAENAALLPDTLFLDPHRFNIVMLHGQIRDSGSGSGAQTIPLPEYRNRNIDYLALGHVHSYEDGALAPGGIWCYPGCLEPRGYDECGRHGFVLLETGQTFRHCFVPFAVREVHALSADVTGCASTGEMAERIRGALKQLEESGAGIPESDFLKIVLRGRLDVGAEKNLLLLERQFSDRFSGVRVEDRTAFSVRYEEYGMEATLKGEFVRLVRADETLTEEEKAEIIRCGIQALGGEEIDL